MVQGELKMTKSMGLLVALLVTPFSLAFANPVHCEYRPPQDGDTTLSYPVRGKPSPDSYAYLVKKDVMGDGKTLVFYPIYSKSWLLTAGQLREVVSKDHFNVIGDSDHQPKITVIRNPADAKDFKTFKEIYPDPATENVCET